MTMGEVRRVFVGEMSDYYHPGPAREICSLCERLSRVGFRVPDDVWHSVMGDSIDIICLACFTRLADNAFVAWDKDIVFYPVSKVAHRRITQDG